MAKRKKFKQINFKLSSRQYSSLQNYCSILNTTPNKLIKGILKNYTHNYSDKLIEKRKMDARQLNLFKEPPPDDYKQLNIFE